MSRPKSTPAEWRTFISLVFTVAWVVATVVVVATGSSLIVVAILAAMTGWSGFTSGIAVANVTKEDP